MAKDEGILRRWARRKAAAREREETPPDRHPSDPDAPASEGGPAARAAPGAEPAGAAAAEAGDNQADAVQDLPDVDSLDKDSDYTGFMREGVPSELRNRALRRLWLSDPIFADLDGLVEYGEDYTDAATVVENMKTAYQVGRGYMSEEEHAALKGKPEETAEAPADAGGEPAAAAEDEAADAGEPDVAAEDGDAPVDGEQAAEADEQEGAGGARVHGKNET